MNNRRKLILALGARALAAPMASFAQSRTGKLARIGVLARGSASSNGAWVQALRANLLDLGYTESKNFVLDFRWDEGNSERLPALAAELVGLQVDIIVAFQTPAVTAAKQATNTIPIVMAGAADPVGSGLVASLARPGGNVTGVSGATSELAAKNLELLREILPSAKHVAILANAADPFTKLFLESLQVAGRLLGIRLHSILVRGEEEFDAAFTEMARTQVKAVFVQPSLPRKRAIELALMHRLPAISPALGFADAGGLMAYTPDVVERSRNTVFYVDKILKGAKPSDLPVQQPTRFELVINLRTAKQIGLKVPRDVLVRADKVIK